LPKQLLIVADIKDSPRATINPGNQKYYVTPHGTKHLLRHKSHTNQLDLDFGVVDRRWWFYRRAFGALLTAGAHGVIKMWVRKYIYIYTI